MLALSKGYQPGLPQLLAVLGLTEDIARQQWRDPLPPPNSSGALGTSRTDDPYQLDEFGRTPAAVAESRVDLPEPGSACWGLVESVRVRRLFGGMGGDLAMLGEYEALWTARFAEGGEAGDGTDDEGRPVPPTRRGGGKGRAGWLGFITGVHGRCLANPAGDKAGLGGYGAVERMSQHASHRSSSGVSSVSTVLLPTTLKGCS